MSPESEPGSRRALFEYLTDPTTRERFFDHVADDVRWTVMGTHPLAGTYTSKREFLQKTFGRLDRLIHGGVVLSVREVHDAGNVAVAELLADAVTNDGHRFDNAYCWVCRFSGDQIVEVRAYLDSALVAATVTRGESAAHA